METPEKFECWGLVEVMGHQRYAGKITEQSVGGCNFVRVDVPAFEGYPEFTKLLGQGSIFSITPTTEQIAKGMAQSFRNTPISVYDLPQRMSQMALTADEIDEEPPY
jgi:hypothetical protein